MKDGTLYPRNTAIAVLLAGHPGAGKCMAKGTPILMYDGTIKRIEDIEVGDWLMGDDSTPRTVLSLARGIDNLYRIKPLRGGDAFDVNTPHVMVFQTSPSTQRKERCIVEIPLNEYMVLSAAKKHRLKLVRSGPVTFEPHARSPIDAYFLGIWLGDGDSSKPSICTPDAEIVDYLHSFAKSWQLQVKAYTYPTSKASSYNLTSAVCENQLKEEMFKLNLIGNKHIPAVFLHGDIETRQHLLAGLLDSDGHLSNSTYEITQQREGLARQIAYVARSLGYSVSMRPKRGQIASTGFVGDYWRVTIVGVSKGELPLRVKRKQALLRRINKDHRVSGFSVIPLGAGDYYGFTLTGNGRYLLGDFTITHNTNLCFEFPRPWFLDADHNLRNGVERHPGVKFKWDDPEVGDDGKPLAAEAHWPRVETLIKAAGADPEVGTIVIDGLGRVTDYLKAYLVHVGSQAEKPLTVGGTKVMTMTLWTPFADLLKRLTFLCRSYGKPFIMTTHLSVDENELTAVKEQRVLLQGALKADYPKLYTDFWYANALPNADVKYKAANGVRYFVRTAPDHRIMLKQSCGLPAEFEHDAPEFKKLLASLAPAVPGGTL